VQEIEAKILEVNSEKVKELLVRFGANKVYNGEIETFFYDFEDGSIIKSGNVMRLRREDKQIVLTYKKVTGTQGVKTAEEYSVAVSDLEMMQEILRFLGLVLIEDIRKHRTSYEIEEVHFDIDRYLSKYGYIPEFLEIEADSINRIHEYARLLGFKPEECLPWSTTQVIEHYSSRKK